MIALFEKYLPKEVCDWPSGSGGMFLWIRLHVKSHPQFASLSPEEISDKCFHTMIEDKVLVAPSIYFKSPGGAEWSKEEEAERIFLRLSFSLPGPEEMEEGVKRMAKALKREFQLE
jgi:aromatic amino acid aminotransferase I